MLIGKETQQSASSSRSNISLKITIKGGFYSETAFFMPCILSFIFPKKHLVVTRKSRIFATNKYNFYIFVNMRIGDKVLISPDLTHAKNWTQGEVIEVEDNPFVGIVISAKTADGNIFFGYKDLFEPVKEAVCTH